MGREAEPSFGSRLISKVLVILSLYGPGASQYITGDPADPLVKYFVDFAGTQAAELLRSCKLSRGSVSEVFPAHALKPLFDEPIQAGSRGNRLPREDDFDLVNPGRNPHRQPFSHAARHDRLRGCPTS